MAKARSSLAMMVASLSSLSLQEKTDLETENRNEIFRFKIWNGIATDLERKFEIATKF